MDFTLLAQIPGNDTLKILTDAGAVGVLAIAVLLLAGAVILVTRGGNKNFEQMLAFTARLTTAVEGSKESQDKVVEKLELVVDSNDRIVSSNDRMIGEMNLTRKSSEDHQIAVVETLDVLRQDLEKTRSSFVGRVDNVATMCQQILTEVQKIPVDKTDQINGILHLLEAMDANIKRAIETCEQKKHETGELKPVTLPTQIEVTVKPTDTPTHEGGELPKSA